MQCLLFFINNNRAPFLKEHFESYFFLLFKNFDATASCYSQFNRQPVRSLWHTGTLIQMAHSQSDYMVAKAATNIFFCYRLICWLFFCLMLLFRKRQSLSFVRTTVQSPKTLTLILRKRKPCQKQQPLSLGIFNIFNILMIFWMIKWLSKLLLINFWWLMNRLTI